MVKLRKVQKQKYGPTTSGLIPKLVEFGMIMIIDENDTKKLYGYIIMNRFQISLKDFMES